MDSLMKTKLNPLFLMLFVHKRLRPTKLSNNFTDNLIPIEMENFAKKKCKH